MDPGRSYARIRAKDIWTSCSDVRDPASKAAFRSATVAESREIVLGSCANAVKPTVQIRTSMGKFGHICSWLLVSGYA